MSQGYKLGKYALAVTSTKNMPEVYCMLYGALNVWKEPIQAILPELLNAYKVGMEVRDFIMQVWLATYHMCNCLSSLPSLEICTIL